MKKRIIILIVFLNISIYSYPMASFACWLWLDDLQCWDFAVFACKIWDQAEYYIAHKAFSLFFYYFGFYGFVGYICYWIEQVIMGKLKISSMFYNIFGITTSIVVGFVVAHFVANLFNISALFEYLYNLVNN